MTNIAYLIGVTGAGKGHIARQFESVTTVITGDIVQHLTGTRLRSTIDG